MKTNLAALLLLVVLSFVSLTAKSEERKLKPRNPEVSQKLLDFVKLKKQSVSSADMKIAIDLLYEGVDPSFQDENGTPLLVRLEDHPAWNTLSKLLTRFYPDQINLTDTQGRTAAMMAAKWDDSGRAVNWYYEDNADVELKDSEGCNVLHYLLRYGFDEATRRSAQLPSPGHSPSRTEMVMKFLGKKDLYPWEGVGRVFLQPKPESVLQADQGGATPLMWAARAFNAEVLDAIYGYLPEDQRLAYVNQTDSRGRTALYYAIEGRNTYALQWLIQRKAKVNIVDQYGESPMFWATRASHDQRLSLVTALVLAGVDRAALIKKSKYPFGEMSVILTKEDSSFLSLFMDLDLDWQMQDPSGGDSLLHLAVQRQSPAAVRMFLEKGVDPNHANIRGYTPLMETLEHKDLASFHILLPLTTNLTQKTEDGKTIEALLQGPFPGYRMTEIHKEMLRLVQEKNKK